MSLFEQLDPIALSYETEVKKALGRFLNSSDVSFEDQNSRKNLDKLRLKINTDYTILSDRIAKHLGLHVNTVKRWWDLQAIPVYYYDDLIRFCEEGETDQRQKGNKEQFYTRPATAAHCLREFKKTASSLVVILDDYVFLEPSAGEGAFFNLFPKSARIGFDLLPTSNSPKEIQKIDYLQWIPPQDKKIVVVGNPPFGLRGHLALQFINKSADFADLIGFIVPQSFASDGKGAPAKRVDRRLRLAYSQELPDNKFLLPDRSETFVRTIFQVWSKVSHDKIKCSVKKTCRKYIRVYSLSDGGTPASTRNKNMLDKCDVYLPSTCFSGMKAYSHFEELPHRRGYGVFIHQCKTEIMRLLTKHDWEQSAFSSTNGALNLRTSLIEDVVLNSGYTDA